MIAKDYLSQVAKLDILVNNKLIEQRQWMDVALGITANMDGERVQTSGAKSKMAEAVEKCVDIEAEINDIVDRLIDTKRDVIATIEKVDSPIEYDLLHKRYIQHMELQEIADHYSKEYGWATTTHGRALKSVQEILDARFGRDERDEFEGMGEPRSVMEAVVQAAAISVARNMRK